LLTWYWHCINCPSKIFIIHTMLNQCQIQFYFFNLKFGRINIPEWHKEGAYHRVSLKEDDVWSIFQLDQVYLWKRWIYSIGGLCLPMATWTLYPGVFLLLKALDKVVATWDLYSKVRHQTWNQIFYWNNFFKGATSEKIHIWYVMNTN
jgi:hypothetical protein